MADVVLVISTAAAWGMVGVIWIVQLDLYPLLGRLSAHEPSTAAVDHQRRISWVVGPLMAAEGVTALWLLVDRPDTLGVLTAWMAAALLGAALLSTAVVQVPQHSRLANGHDDEVVRSLISGNWIRTIAWTARGMVLAAALATVPS